MTTEQEALDIIFTEISKIKKIYSKYLGIRQKDITREGLKNILIKTFEKNRSKLNTIKEDEVPDNLIPKEVIKLLYLNKNYIADCVQDEFDKDNGYIKIKFFYKDQPFSVFSLPCNLTETDSPIFFTVANGLIKSLFVDGFFNPLLRKMIMENSPGYENWVNSYFDKINSNTGRIMLTIIKDNWPDFYEFITTKKEIPKLEELDSWLKHKEELRIFK